jgi:hypothetical protein
VSNSTAVVLVSITASVLVPLSSPHSFTLIRVPSGPFGATLLEFNFATLTAVPEAKTAIGGGDRVVIRRNWFKDTFEKVTSWWKKTWNGYVCRDGRKCD